MPRGNCYVTSEALFHLLGGKAAGWKACTLHHEGATHWYLENANGARLDATVSQFKRAPDYATGRGRGFLTREPSKRARDLMARMVYQLERT